MGYNRWFGKCCGLLEEKQEAPSDDGPRRPPEGYLHRKQAESFRGFLVYVSKAFKSMIPYLKDIHLTLDHWRPNRDEDGWRMLNMSGEDGRTKMFQIHPDL